MVPGAGEHKKTLQISKQLRSCEERPVGDTQLGHVHIRKGNHLARPLKEAVKPDNSGST